MRRLRDEGFRVSIDSFDRREVELATKAGANLVLAAVITQRPFVEKVVAPYILMLVTTQCATYCRYCTRSRIVGDPSQNFNRAEHEVFIGPVGSAPYETPGTKACQ